MNAELSFFGVFTPSIIPCAIFAALLTAALTRLLAAIEFYRLVWRPALFNFSLFVCTLAAVLAATAWIPLR